MVENKCSKCGQQSPYTINVNTDREYQYTTKMRDGDREVDVILDSSQIVERWCFDCLRSKIVWPEMKDES